MKKTEEKDFEKARRLTDAYHHIYGRDGITSQSAWADRLQVQRTALSAAMNGNAAYLTKNLFIKVCAAHPNVFNLDYFLTGQGSLLASQPQASTLPGAHPSDAGTSAIIELYATLIKELEAMRSDLASDLRAVQELKYQLTQEREALHTITTRLHAVLHPSVQYDLPSASTPMAAEPELTKN